MPVGDKYGHVTEERLNPYLPVGIDWTTDFHSGGLAIVGEDSSMRESRKCSHEGVGRIRRDVDPAFRDSLKS